MSQFPDVNPYRYPAWFVTALSLANIIIVILLFREPRPFAVPKHCKTCSRSTHTRLKISVQLSSGWCMHLLVSSINDDACINYIEIIYK